MPPMDVVVSRGAVDRFLLSLHRNPWGASYLPGLNTMSFSKMTGKIRQSSVNTKGTFSSQVYKEVGCFYKNRSFRK